MKKAHTIVLSVFSHEKDNEDLDLIKEKCTNLSGIDLKKEKLDISCQESTGFNEKKITVLALTLEKDRHIRQFLVHINTLLDHTQKEKILLELESRLDEELHFFLRFDKKEFVQNNYLQLTDSGNCFHIKMSIAAFPKKRDKAVEIVKGMFNA